jgi:hypothetical protein
VYVTAYMKYSYANEVPNYITVGCKRCEIYYYWQSLKNSKMYMQMKLCYVISAYFQIFTIFGCNKLELKEIYFTFH